jgi:hypothetical protein
MCAMTLNEVQQKTELLDKASEVPLKIDDGGVIKDVNSYKGIYNVSKGKFCAAVIKHYNLIQHKEYVDSFARCLDNLNIQYNLSLSESGNKVFADFDFIRKNIKMDKVGEEFSTGIRLINSYSGRIGLSAMPKFTRLACSNGMVVTRFEKSFSVHHTSKMLINMQGFVERQLNGIINHSVDLQNWVEESIKDSKEWLIITRIIEKLFSQPKHREQVLDRLGIAMIVDKKRSKGKSKKYLYALNDDVETKNVTRWEVYNAITHYLTHGEQMTPHIYDLFQRKAERVLVNRLEKLPMAEVVL